MRRDKLHCLQFYKRTNTEACQLRKTSNVMFWTFFLKIIWTAACFFPLVELVCAWIIDKAHLNFLSRVKVLKLSLHLSDIMQNKLSFSTMQPRYSSVLCVQKLPMFGWPRMSKCQKVEEIVFHSLDCCSAKQKWRIESLEVQLLWALQTRFFR